MPFFIFWKLYKPGHRALRDWRTPSVNPHPHFFACWVHWNTSPLRAGQARSLQTRGRVGRRPPPLVTAAPLKWAGGRGSSEGGSWAELRPPRASLHICLTCCCWPHALRCAQSQWPAPCCASWLRVSSFPCEPSHLPTQKAEAHSCWNVLRCAYSY